MWEQQPVVPSHVHVFREGNDGHAGVADDGSESQLAFHFDQVVDVPGQERRRRRRQAI